MTQEMLLELQTADGSWKTISIPLRLLAKNPAKVLRRLKAAGVVIAPGADQLVIQYLIDQTSRLSSAGS
jgi:hypothetical protein